jgi:hypothetical protein
MIGQVVARYFSLQAALIAGLLTTGCNMAETATPASPIEALGAEHIKSAPLPANAKSAAALDDQLLALVGKDYGIKSSQYFKVARDIPWIAIAKNVQNQMLEKSIKKGDFSWEDPGLVFVEVYPQGAAAFAVAMDSNTADAPEKFIGYYVLEVAK